MSDPMNPSDQNAPAQDPSLQPAPPPTQPPATPEQPKNSMLSKIALGVSIAGFLFGVIPGAIAFGWFLLFVGFVLGVVAAFQKGKKTFAAVAIILSVVGTIISMVASLLFVGKALDDAFSGDVVIGVEEEADTEDAEGADETAEGGGEDTSGDEDAEDGDATALGTREDPIEVGIPFSSKDWEVVVNSIDPDATDEIISAKPMMNSEPEDGSQYMLINLTATYLGEDSSLDSVVQVAYVTDGGEVFKGYESVVFAPDPTFGAKELYTDSSSTGNIAIEIPEGSTGLVRVEPGLFADEVFIAIP